MRRLFTFAAVLMVGTAMMAQNKVPYAGKLQTHQLKKQVESASTAQRTDPSTTSGTGTDMSTATITKLLTLPNAFGYAITPYQHQLTAWPEMNAVGFCNRQDPNTYGGGGSGSLRYSVSIDKGLTWTDPLATGIINSSATSTQAGRFPNGILFPSGGTTPADLKYHIVAPAIDFVSSPAVWTYQTQITIHDPSNPATAYSAQEDYVYNGRAFYSVGGNITERVHNSGDFWMATGSTATAPDPRTEYFYIFRGTFDNATEKMNWTMVDSITTNWNTAVDGSTHHLDPIISFSPDGTKGYVATVGDMVGESDSAYAPVIWTYDGNSFVNPTQVNLQYNPAIMDYIKLATDTLGVPYCPDGKPSCTFGFDLTVDNMGNPHITTQLCAAWNTNSAYAAYSVVGSLQARNVDIHPVNGVWQVTPISRQNTFRADIGQDPAGTVYSEDPQMLVSRSLDGKYLFYTWTDSDTTFVDNDAPDAWGRMLDVEKGLLTDSVNWTLNDPNWHTRAHTAKASEYPFETTSTSSCGRTFELPTSIIYYANPTTGGYGACDIYYFTDITYKCEDAVKGMENIPLSPFVSVQPALGMTDVRVYPNPTKDILNIGMKLSNPDNVTISLVNVNGQTVMSKVVENTSSLSERLNVSDLASGLYFLQVTNSKGTQAQKVVID